jgi:hypothetical protein
MIQIITFVTNNRYEPEFYRYQQPGFAYHSREDEKYAPGYRKLPGIEMDR